MRGTCVNCKRADMAIQKAVEGMICGACIASVNGVRDLEARSRILKATAERLSALPRRAKPATTMPAQTHVEDKPQPLQPGKVWPPAKEKALEVKEELEGMGEIVKRINDLYARKIAALTAKRDMILDFLQELEKEK